MFRSKGFYLPYKYFIENHLFDLKRNINTHSLVEKKHFNEKIDNLANGVHYACSWESTIVFSLKKAISKIDNNDNAIIFFTSGLLLIFKSSFTKKNDKIQKIGNNKK